jgi:ATPase subunit of ABC transporter with duplicated ATPase domains
VVGPLDVELCEGEVLGVLGPNGSGKSTLLHALAGTAHRFAGSTWRAPGSRMAVLAQHAPDASDLPVSGQDLLRLAAATAPAALQGRLLALAGRRLDRLSGGELRLLLDLAALGSPATVVLLDEPTNDLDAPAVELVTAMLRGGALRTRAVMVVSHDAGFVSAVCSRTLQMPT